MTLDSILQSGALATTAQATQRIKETHALHLRPLIHLFLIHCSGSLPSLGEDRVPISYDGENLYLSKSEPPSFRKKIREHSVREMRFSDIAI